MNASNDTAEGQTFPQGPLDQELEFLWQERDQSGNAYDLYLGRISRNPVVRSHATGKYFMLPWSEIVKLAVEHEEEKGDQFLPQCRWSPLDD